MSRNRKNRGINIISKAEESVVVKQLIKDEKNKDEFGILLFRQDTLDEIFEASKPLSVSNEFQFHYTSLVGTTRDEENDQTFRVSIPLVCYNYKQKVSGAAIDFNLQDVEDIANELMPIAQEKAAEFLNSEEKNSVEEIFGEIDWTIVPYQSMHRHPGGSSQGFSGTDYTKNIDAPGVVFPFTNPVEPTLSFASIMYVSGDRCKIAHTEMRIALKDDEDILYHHGRSITSVKGIKTTPTFFENMFRIKSDGVEDYFINDGVGSDTVIQKKLMELVNLKPEVFIDGTLLSSHSYGRYDRKDNYHQGRYNKNAYNGLFKSEENNSMIIDYEPTPYPRDEDFSFENESTRELFMPKEKKTEFKTEAELREFYASEDFDCLDISTKHEGYIHDPAYMIEMDRNILKDAILEEIDLATGYNRQILERCDDDRIFEIAREFSILADPIVFNKEELKV